MGTVKTGLANLLRAWMRERKRPFTPLQMSIDLQIPEGPQRARVWNAIKDFQKRGEVERTESGKYRYNHSYKRSDFSPLKERILKAVYVSISGFSTSDIQKLTNAQSKNYISKVLRGLLRNNYIQLAGIRKCSNGRGYENLYAVVLRDRFRLDLLK